MLGLDRKRQAAAECVIKVCSGARLDPGKFVGEAFFAGNTDRCARKLLGSGCRLQKELSVKRANSSILTINGGSSSIKFALFEANNSLRWILEGGIERIGLPDATLRVKGSSQAPTLNSR
jgi:hypothetical protein